MATSQKIEELLSSRKLDDPKYATQIVEGLLQKSIEAGASDLHFQPSEEGLQLGWFSETAIIEKLDY